MTDRNSVADVNPPVLIRIRSLLPDLRPSERRIAELFLTDPTETSALSVAALAAKGSTSTTTVIRLCKRLGYPRLQDLRIDVLNAVARENFETAALSDVSGDIDQDDSLENVVAKISMAETLSLADTAKALRIDELARAAELVGQASRVDIFGVGASAFVGLDLQQKLTRIGRVALSWSDSHSAWTSAATLRNGSVAVAISHSGNTADTIDFLAIARGAGAATIAITNHDASELTEHADVVLTTAARETVFRSGALGSRIAQLMVVDCLFIAVAKENYDESIADLRRTYAAVQSRRVRGS
ncbi:MurR/RpiR family transcriptional regulator [Microbacterium hatanonis]